MKYGSGWFRESYRHSLAARHIKTSFAVTDRNVKNQMQFIRPAPVQDVKDPNSVNKWIAETDGLLNDLVRKAKSTASPEVEETLLQVKKDNELLRFSNPEVYKRLNARIEFAEKARNEFYKNTDQKQRDALFLLTTGKDKRGVTVEEITALFKSYPEFRATGKAPGVNLEAGKTYSGTEEKMKPVEAPKAAQPISKELPELKKVLDSLSDEAKLINRYGVGKLGELEREFMVKAISIKNIFGVDALPKDIKSVMSSELDLLDRMKAKTRSRVR
jgi:hypothetical protein